MLRRRHNHIDCYDPLKHCRPLLTTGSSRSTSRGTCGSALSHRRCGARSVLQGTVSYHSLKHFAAAHCVQEAVSSHLLHYQVALSPNQSRDDGEIKGKECSNLMVLLCELYNLQVISCILMYDLIRSLLSGVVTELDVEILLKILRSMYYYLSFRRASDHW